MSGASPWVRARFFRTAADFRRWLQRHHRSTRELWVGFHKKATGRPSMTWPESVDEALCFGWIDGVRRSLDAGSYAIRFTPRRADSSWSLVNTRRARALMRDGRMTSAGRLAFEARDPSRTRRASYERQAAPALDRVSAARFRANRPAWTYFMSQAQGYRRTALWWVVSARLAATRERRLSSLIEDSAAGLRIAALRRARPDRARATTRKAAARAK